MPQKAGEKSHPGLEKFANSEFYGIAHYVVALDVADPTFLARGIAGQVSAHGRPYEPDAVRAAVGIDPGLAYVGIEGAIWTHGGDGLIVSIIPTRFQGDGDSVVDPVDSADIHAFLRPLCCGIEGEFSLCPTVGIGLGPARCKATHSKATRYTFAMRIRHGHRIVFMTGRMECDLTLPGIRKALGEAGAPLLFVKLLSGQEFVC